MTPFILHDTDRDGYGAAYAAWRVFGEQATYLPLTDRTAPPYDDIPEGARVYVVDYSWSPEHLRRLADRCILTIIDHHQSAIQAVLNESDKDAFWSEVQYSLLDVDTIHRARIEEPFEYVFHNEKSAAVLAWEYFHKDPPPRLLQHIQDYDLWNWALDDTDAVTLALDANGYDDFETIHRYAGDHFPELVEEGQHMIRYRDRLVKDIARQAVTVSFEEYDEVPFVNTSTLHSQVGNYLLETTGAPLVLIGRLAVEDEDIVFRYSLRADGDVDCGAIAAKYGGGGHKNAAGFTATTPIHPLPQELMLA